jgi:hypothetical protein
LFGLAKPGGGTCCKHDGGDHDPVASSAHCACR